MPKERRDHSTSLDRSRVSPFPCSASRKAKQSSSKNLIEKENNVDNIKEWEDARCPVCMEHPHNAVLLLCSSIEKGCRPFMCDTSYRHSNCLDQFRKSFSETPSSTTRNTPLEESPHGDTPSSRITAQEAERNEEEGSCTTKEQHKLVCPLCRGQVSGWKVVEPAREFMNAKNRSCACETCDYSGTYTDLRKHARMNHPLVRPSLADPERQRSWRRMERQRDLGDLLSTIQSAFGEERGEDSGLLPIDEGGWLTVFFLIRVFRPGSSPRSSSWSSTSRARAQVSIRRRSTRLWGESYEGESGSGSRDESNESSDGGSTNPWRRTRRRTAPSDEP